jgi:transcription antitermination factor NusG
LNWEKAVLARLTGKGYPAFLPLYPKSARTCGQGKPQPLFPGYVFSSFDVALRMPILTIPGVLHVVGRGHTPEPVDPYELLAIERFVDSGMELEPWTFLKNGELALVERGPLTGLKGIFIEASQSQRLVVSLSLLEQSVAVEINRDDLRLVGVTA